MKIIILGAGQVGSSVAENLISEDSDITVIDLDGHRVMDLQSRLDLRGVVGDAAHPSTLRKAGIEDADLLIAVTRSDEVNLVACKIAATLFNVPTRIARIRSTDYLAAPELLGKDGFEVTASIHPEQIVTDYLARLMEYPEALRVLQMGRGLLTMVLVRISKASPMVGQPVSDLQRRLTKGEARIVALYRHDMAIVPNGATVVEAGDEVFCLAATADMRDAVRELCSLAQPVRRVMIAGGGNIGLRLAKALDGKYQVKLIEEDKQRAEYIAQQVSDVLVLNGDAADEDLLETENVAEMDVFVALTNDDENNIMSSLLAKRMGARRVISLINRRAYADLMDGGPIDITISPAQATIGSLLAKIRRGDVVAVHSLRRGSAEVLELVVHGNARSCKAVGRRVDELALPEGSTIGAIVRKLEMPRAESNDNLSASLREYDVLIPHGDTMILDGDHVIVLVADKRMLPKVEKLFQVGFTFI